MRWIRWRGLAAFVVAVAAISIVWFVFADRLVKWAVERTGTALVGARVELAGADLTLFPLGVTLTGIQVTNPDEPMRNAVEVKRCALLIDGVNILRRKLIVDDMSIDGVRLDTARRYSGAVSRRAAKEKEKEKKSLIERFALPAFKVPDVKEVLANEDLESIRLIKETDASIKKDRGRLKEEVSGLLDKEKIDAFRARFEKIKSTSSGGPAGLLGGAGELLSLQNDLKAEIKKAQAARKDVEKALSEYGKRLEAARAAPSKDVQRIKQKYALTPEGLSNISRSLFGPEMGGYAGAAVRWYRRLQPIVSRAAQSRGGVKVEKPIRGPGVDVRFPEYRPMPDFLVRVAALSVDIPVGEIKGRITDLTNAQDVLGRPTRFAFSGARLKGLSSLSLNGEINRVSPRAPLDHAEFRMKGYKLSSVPLVKRADFPVTLKDALAAVDVDTRITGQALKANVAAGFSSVEMAAGGAQPQGVVERAVASALSGVKDFSLKADVAGTLDDYSITISSDLDRALKGAVGRVAEEQAARFEKELRDGVMAKAAAPLEDLKGSMDGIRSIDGDLNRREGLANGLLEQIGAAAMGGVKLPKLPF